MDFLAIVVDFAGSVEKAIGTEETTELLTSLAKFAKECPDTLVEIKELVEDNPQIFKTLLTRDGVVEAKQMIDQVSLLAPMLGKLGK